VEIFVALIIGFFASVFGGIVAAILVLSVTTKREEPVIAKSAAKRKGKPTARKRGAHAMNAAAQVLNSVVDQQKIRTAEIEIQVIAEDVLTYEGGELGASYPDKTRLYYPADAIKDPDYLETILRSPFQMQTHQKNTSEFNRSVDGWPVKSWWDDTNKRAMASGFIHGEDNVKYAEENKHLPTFGTSAFITFLKIEKTAGTAPNGKPYDAIARKMVNNHVAILPGIRDPRSVIVAMNAVEENKIDESTENADEIKRSGFEEAQRKRGQELDRRIAAGEFKDANKQNKDYSKLSYEEKRKALGLNAEGKRMPFDKEEFKNAMNEYEADKAKEDEKAEKIKNAIKNELKEESSKAVTSTATGGANAPESSGGDTAEIKSAGKGENSETSSSKTATASNAILPSEEMVKDFSNHLGVTFAKTPSLGDLASLVGIKATEPAELVSALNAKREEFKTKIVKTEATNAGAPSLQDLMKSI